MRVFQDISENSELGLWDFRGACGSETVYALNQFSNPGVPKPYPIVMSEFTSSEKQIPRNC